jgi:hypothetical protein
LLWLMSVIIVEKICLRCLVIVVFLFLLLFASCWS